MTTQATPLTPVISRHWDDPESWTLATYQRHDRYRGYQALQKALTMPPDDVISIVKDSGLRGRGGAGFATGTKWSFIPQGDTGAAAKPHYLVVNADESEPGTCKDIPLMLATPHVLIEGVIIAAYAIRAHHAFVYVRGEVVPVLRRLHNAVAEAYAAGFLGRNIGGSGFDLELVVHAGAGAYICGEETALLDSLEGRRGQPRLRPPFPAVAGLYGCPTVINNVETIASVPSIILGGIDWFRSMGSEKSPGFTLYSLSGHVTASCNSCLATRPGTSVKMRSARLLLVRRSSGHRAARRPRCSPTSIWMCRWTTRVWVRPARCWGPRRWRSSTRPPAWCARCAAGPSSTSTNRVGNARRAGRAPSGWIRSTSGWKPAGVAMKTLTNCWTFPIPSWESRSARWATVPRVR
ncbi:NADH dehydrogenase subunit I F nuoF [Mycobacterium tuberculosis '98-R604 INH-RIF-EM']|nr:NADH dehydrogenase subunit I F nuoF [Mycobacterium tuberculosis '98-R604 INH-RIF-EM']